MNKLIDMHFHLDFYANHSETYKRINSLEQHTLCVTNQPEIFESCIDLYKPTQYVQFALGYHPQNAGKISFNNSSFINNLYKTKYVGEVGLDFSKEYAAFSDIQLRVFDFICGRAVDKIMTIHCKKAEEDVYRIIKKNGNHKVIMHWYSGNEYWLDKLIDLGCYFSINSNMLSSTKGIMIIDHIPLERLFIESDGPFTKVDGKRYTIEKLKTIYDQTAQMRKLSDEVLRQQITKNYMELIQ